MIQKFREYFLLFVGFILFFVVWLAFGNLIPRSWGPFYFALSFIIPVLVWLYFRLKKKPEEQ
jgi:hypothetical protein